MNKKWALFKSSDIGPMGRGQAGKKKVYEITLDRCFLICSWGMAEKPKRQTNVQVFSNEQAALVAAYDKLHSKVGSGYEIAYEV
jgi:predicted DNA-binding WGR domain protein